MKNRSNEQLCALAQKGNTNARDLLLENNFGFIRKTANEIYFGMNLGESELSIDKDDLEQEGCIGLLDAIPRFDSSKGTKFLTYAAPSIRNAMTNLIRDAFSQYEQRMVDTKDGLAFQKIRLDEVVPGEERMLRIEAIADPIAKSPEQIYVEQEIFSSQTEGTVMTLGQMNSKLMKAQEAETHLDRALICRALLEDAVDFIYSKAGVKKPPKASLLELIDSPVVTGYINDADTVNALHYVRILGMNAKHGRSVRKKEAKLAYDNMSYLIGLISSKENGTESAYRKPPYMSEAATRRLYIDLYLKEAGWDVLNVENLAQPGKAGIEIEVQGMPNAHGVGYCDYVLYGKDGKPLAIIEVKKTSVDPEKGRHQVDLYGECMKKVYGYKPVLYYTNGYSTKIIDGIYPDRPVMAFHTMEDLELMLQRRTRGDITDLTINDEITNRPYQKMAITNICEWLNAKHRRGLLVMATGTGKTRVAISLVDVLTRNNWVKNVLFLADRTSLVNQAKRNFAKLMPNMSVCELSAGGEKDFNARLMFCTYQTMINYIDAEDKRFSSGRFDLIIIDEAHRSIFNRYGTIFKYFDSFLVGLTATPKNDVCFLFMGTRKRPLFLHFFLSRGLFCG